MSTRASALSSAALLVFACWATPLALTNARAWANALRTGTIEGTYSLPICEPMLVPDGHGFGVSGKRGADHASLFLTAKDYLARGEMYDPQVDPWARTAESFPPHLVFLTAHGTARFDFATSALLNNFAQVILLLVVSAYFLRHGSSSWASKIGGVAAGAFAVFCTPVGVCWFERAQTDLYCASAMLLLLKGMRDDTWHDFALAGLVASMKWSSLPFFAVAALPYVLLASGPPLRRIVLVGGAMSLPFVLLFFFGEDTRRYLALIYRSELGHFGGPKGVSMARHFPLLVSKVLPFTLPLLFVAVEKLRKDRRGWSSAELVFWATAGLVAATYGTTAYEYRLLSTIYILPLVIDGRSILFPQQRARFSNASRVIALVFLAYALRVETFPFVDMLISRGRDVVPLFVGVSLIVTFFVFESRLLRHPAWRTRVPGAPAS